MSLELFRLLFDFGLVVLIWLVQLVIYPNFKFYRRKRFLKWHKRYTVGISLVVVPLMFGQLITAILQVFEIRNSFTIGSLILIVMLWAITFLKFVPMHREIAKGQVSDTLLNSLVKQNWSRTLLWTILFIWSILNYPHT